MPQLKPGTIWPTEEEDREITRQARDEGTLHSDEELAEFKPIEESALPEALKQWIAEHGEK